MMNPSKLGWLGALALSLSLAACGGSVVNEGDAGDPDAGLAADAATVDPDAGVVPDAGNLPDAGDDVDAGDVPDAGDEPDGGSINEDTIAPTITATLPLGNAIDVAINTQLSVTFSELMEPTTINGDAFTLGQGLTPVAGIVTYVGLTATFVPTTPLNADSVYTATVSVDAEDVAGNGLAAPLAWTFTTGPTVARGPAPVGLGAAGNYVVLAKTAISSVPASVVTGNLGLSPAAASFITGFSLVADATNVFSNATQVVGQVFAANYAVPTPSNLTTAVSNMENAYTDAAGRVTPDFTNHMSGALGGQTLAPGLYKFTSSITMGDNVVLDGNANDVWIFQTSGDLSMSAAKTMTLTGGAQAKNVFWQVAGGVTFGAGAHFEGIILCKTNVALQTGASMNGRILAQTSVALQQATLTQPAN